jgi:hypothetical protein
MLLMINYFFIHAYIHSFNKYWEVCLYQILGWMFKITCPGEAQLGEVGRD